MTFTKIQVIKILRDNIPGLGLRDAKAIVDKVELKSFEDRVARAMGEEARAELRTWAVMFNTSRNDAFNAEVPVVKAYRINENGVAEPYKYSEPINSEFKYVARDDGYCGCEDCVNDREERGYASGDFYREPVKKASEIWCLDTGIEVMDPDGWNRKDYDNSWCEEITRDEFIRRAGMSTCKRWPDPLLDESDDYTLLTD